MRTPPIDLQAWPCQSRCAWLYVPERLTDSVGADMRLFRCAGCGSEWVRTEPWTPINDDGVVPVEVAVERARCP